MSTATAHAYDLDSYWKDLTDPGKRREFVRLKPSESTPVTAAANGESGWELGDRELSDISLGGVGIDLNMLEARRVRVGEMVRLLLCLGDRSFNVHGRAVRLTRYKAGLLPRFRMGIEFVGDASLLLALSDLVETLHRLNDESDHQFTDIR